MSSPTKRVAVIGAGVSGLVSIKCCNDEGLGPVCFEQSEEIAGIWNYHDNPREGDGAALYENLVTNTSKNMMCFSDFPFSREAPPYLRHHLVLRYYQQYAEHFGLYKFIKFNTKVLKIKPVANFSQTGQWEVYVKTNGQSERKEVYDAVMCCTGLNSSPYMPEIEGMDLFEGSVLHSNRFRRDSDFREKTVVVVGDAYSAGDVAVETSRCAKQVYISMRDGTFVIRRMGSKAIPIHERTHKRVMKLLPVAVRNYALETLVLSELNHTRMGLKSSKPMYKHRVMINDEIANRIFCGAVECKPVIQQLNKRSVKFVDGTVVDDVDAVICATGYNATFPYLDNDVLAETSKPHEMYMYVFPPRMKMHTLAFIGFAGVADEAAPVNELQARWVTRVFKGVCRLPDEGSMIKDITTRNGEFYKTYRKITVDIPGVEYKDRLADFIGAKPSFWKLLLTDPNLAYAVMFGSCYPATYRLTGPGMWDKARENIINARENHPTCTTLQEMHQGEFKLQFKFMMVVMVIAVASVFLLPLIL